MVGSLVRHKYSNKVGIVLRRVTRRGYIRYHVYMDNQTLTFASSFLEVL